MTKRVNHRKGYAGIYIRCICLLLLTALSTKAQAQRYAGFMDDMLNISTDSLMMVDGVRYYMLYVDYNDVHFVSLLSEKGERYIIGPAVPEDTVFHDGQVYARLGCETLSRPLAELKHDSMFVENEYPDLFERCEATSPCNFRACDTNNFGCELMVDYPTAEGEQWDVVRDWIVDFIDAFTNMDAIYFDDVFLETNIDQTQLPMAVLKRNNPAAFVLQDKTVGQDVLDHYRDVYMRQVYYLKNEDFGYPLCYLRAFITPRYVSDDYVTLFVSTDFFAYGAHDFPAERYVTFDMRNHRLVNNDNLFKKGKIDKVKDILEEQMELDDRYIGKNPMPQAAIMPQGVVFSFQPYQVGTYSEGLFHYVIPYQKLQKLFAK